MPQRTFVAIAVQQEADDPARTDQVVQHGHPGPAAVYRRALDEQRVRGRTRIEYDQRRAREFQADDIGSCKAMSQESQQIQETHAYRSRETFVGRPSACRPSARRTRFR